MTNTFEDYDPDDAYEAFNEMIHERINEQEWDNIVGFYLKDKEKCKAIVESLDLSRDLFEKNYYQSSLIHANIAIELIIKDLFVSPLLIGSVFNDIISELITTLIFENKNISYFDKVFRHLLQDRVSINLENYKNKNIWKQIISTRSLRNKVIHSGVVIEQSDANMALETALILFNDITDMLLKSFRLKVDKYQIIRIK